MFKAHNSGWSTGAIPIDKIGGVAVWLPPVAWSPVYGLEPDKFTTAHVEIKLADERCAFETGVTIFWASLFNFGINKLFLTKNFKLHGIQKF